VEDVSGVDRRLLRAVEDETRIYGFLFRSS
jgi:hypothetical protein